ncbi:MAG: hypothetical protein ACRD5L_11715, partial [Bryobacteraceae bacterium]
SDPLAIVRFMRQSRRDICSGRHAMANQSTDARLSPERKPALWHAFQAIEGAQATTNKDLSIAQRTRAFAREELRGTAFTPGRRRDLEAVLDRDANDRWTFTVWPKPFATTASS